MLMSMARSPCISVIASLKLDAMLSTGTEIIIAAANIAISIFFVISIFVYIWCKYSDFC
jgi:hypothetical protein